MIFYACPKVKNILYKYTSADVTTYNTDTLYPKVVLENSEVDARDLVFNVRLSSEVVAANYKSPFLTNTAYAFNFHDYYYNTSPLKSIKFITLSDYNTTYKAGDDIVNAMYFGLYTPDMLYDSSNGKTFIKFYNEVNYYRESYQKPPEGTFEMKFNELPTLKTAQQFAMAIELKDGTILRDTTTQFIVK
jgi:hypothetical protein